MVPVTDGEHQMITVSWSHLSSLQTRLGAINVLKKSETAFNHQKILNMFDLDSLCDQGQRQLLRASDNSKKKSQTFSWDCSRSSQIISYLKLNITIYFREESTK